MWQQGPTYFCLIPKNITSRYKQNITWQRIYLPTSWYPFGFHQRKDLATTMTRNKENYAQKKEFYFQLPKKKLFERSFLLRVLLTTEAWCCFRRRRKQLKRWKQRQWGRRWGQAPGSKKMRSWNRRKFRNNCLWYKLHKKAMSRHWSIRTSL